MNTAQLIETCHQLAKEKGFWDKERNMPEAFALIISELYEAFEAHRKGRFANMQQFNELTNSGEYTFENSPITSKYHFEQHIKDTFEDELADVLIRLFDFCGGYNIKLDFFNEKTYIDKKFKNSNNFGEKVLKLTQIASFEYYVSSVTNSVNILYHYTLYLYKELNIDIETHIELKLQYNATREKLHGKKY